MEIWRRRLRPCAVGWVAFDLFYRVGKRGENDRQILAHRLGTAREIHD